MASSSCPPFSVASEPHPLQQPSSNPSSEGPPPSHHESPGLANPRYSNRRQSSPTNSPSAPVGRESPLYHQHGAGTRHMTSLPLPMPLSLALPLPLTREGGSPPLSIRPPISLPLAPPTATHAHIGPLIGGTDNTVPVATAVSAQQHSSMLLSSLMGAR